MAMARRIVDSIASAAFYEIIPSMDVLDTQYAGLAAVPKQRQPLK
jgi:hypothetical protein